MIDPYHFRIVFLVDHVGYDKILGMFREAAGTFTFDDETLELPSKVVLPEDVHVCDGEEVEIRVLKLNTLFAEKPAVFTEDLRDVRLDQDGQLFMVAMVTKDTKNSEIPRPDDTYLRQYLNLPEAQQPLGQEESDETGPFLPITEQPFSTEEPISGGAESDEPNDD